MSTAAGLPTPTVQTERPDTLLADVSAERMTATVAALASNAFTGRRVGTAGGTAARFAGRAPLVSGRSVSDGARNSCIERWTGSIPQGHPAIGGTR
jgi:hypothetical protein